MSYTTPQADKLIRVHVRQKARAADGIVCLKLAAADGHALPAFEPGAHIEVHMPGDISRAYSLCGPLDDLSEYTIAVLREPQSRGGSAALHELVNQGDELAVSAPRNLFPLQPGAAHSLLMAGGIGITPILCMAEALHRARRSFELHYFCRTRARAAFVSDLQAAPFASRVTCHFDDEPTSQQPSLLACLRDSPPDSHVYVCGPQGFIDAVREHASALRWGDSRVHFESFAPATAREGDTAFEVVCARSAARVSVSGTQTIIEALQLAGVDVPTACEQGACGTCVTQVLEGLPQHRDSFLTAKQRAENKLIVPCCSRALSKRLVLDI